MTDLQQFIVVILAIVFFVSISFEFHFGVVLSLAIAWVFFEWGCRYPIWIFIKEHGAAIGVSFGGYLLIGLLISILKFYLTYKARVDHLERLKDEQMQSWMVTFDGKHPSRRTPAQLAKMWNDFVERNLPSTRGMTSQIISWMIYWPFVIGSLILKDLMWNIGQQLYQLTASIFRGIEKKLKSRLLTNDVSEYDVWGYKEETDSTEN